MGTYRGIPEGEWEGESPNDEWQMQYCWRQGVDATFAELAREMAGTPLHDYVRAYLDGYNDEMARRAQQGD